MQDSQSFTGYLPKSLAHCQNVVSLILCYRYLFARCLSELAQLVLLLFSKGRSTHYSERLYDFSINILDVTRMSMSTISFLVQLDWKSLPIECLTLTYDLNGFKSRVIRHLILTVDSFKRDSLNALIYLCYFFL